MVTIRDYVQKVSNDDKKHIIAEISVASSSELVTELDDYAFEEGSIAWDITNGDFYGLVGGSWVKQND